LISSKFNFNSTLASIIHGEPDGVVREHLINYASLEKNQQLINYAYDLESALNDNVLLAVKFPFGSRSKRIEIVFKTSKFIVLCKFTSSNRIDQAALELQSIISSIDKKPDEKCFKGLVVYPFTKQKAITDKFAANQIPDVRFDDIKNLKSGKFLGLFNQPKSSS
jgi:hypothetical protein